MLAKLRELSLPGLLLGVLLSVTAIGAATAEGTAPAAEPEQVVQKTTDDLLVLIDGARAYAEAEPDRFFREVEALLDPVVDFDGFARSVMATHYKVATPEQRKRFAESFKWSLVRTYAMTLLEFGEEGEVRVLPPDGKPSHPRRSTVAMEIETPGGDVYPVNYSMALGRDGQWRIRNLIVNGVNIGLTYRSQFASAAQDRRYGGDLDKVIEAWGEVVAEAEAAAEDDAASPAGELTSS